MKLFHITKQYKILELDFDTTKNPDYGKWSKLSDDIMVFSILDYNKIRKEYITNNEKWFHLTTFDFAHVINSGMYYTTRKKAEAELKKDLEMTIKIYTKARDDMNDKIDSLEKILSDE